MLPRVALALALLLSYPTIARGETVEVGPDDAWCDAIDGAAPGDEVVLAPGRYTSPCVIRAAGTEGAPIVVRGSSTDEGSRSILDYDGSSSNVIDFDGEAAFVTLRDLFWDPTNPAIDAIKIKAGHDLVIEGCRFEAIGGIAISANSSSVERITVRNSAFVDLRATGMYFGCHDGEGCQATDIRVEGNLIDGVSSDSVGYGVQVKLNSWAVIRDNTIYDTKGPGIMVYGSSRGDPPSVVEGNYVEGSRTDGAIVVGGGPAIVRNNVALGGSLGGIVAQDYGGRGLQQGVWIVHNTSFANDGPSIRVQSWAAGAGNVLAANALGSATQPASPEGTVMANVTCDPLGDCFVDPATAPYDLWPTADGPLLDAAGSGEAEWSPTMDFMGEPRDAAPDVGAFERVAEDTAHRVGGGDRRPPRTGGTGPTTDGGAPPPDGGGVPVHDGGGLPRADGGAATDAGAAVDLCPEGDDCEGTGCSCSTASPGQASTVGLVLLALVLRRRRRGSPPAA